MRRLRRRSAATTDHFQDIETIAQLRRDAQELSSQFRLAYREVSPENPRVKRRYGLCTHDGRIFVRLRHVRTGKLLKYSSLVNTLCHELAHLRHFNHGPRFKRFYLEILEHARRRGIYRPGLTGPRRAIQLGLFSSSPFP